MSKDTDILNVGLIIISLFLAFQLPFELFLFSYAVLGPMHYLTEISWLRDKNYFVRERKAIWILVFFVAIVTVPVLMKLSWFSGIEDIKFIRRVARNIRSYYSEVILGTLIFAIGLIYFTRRLHLMLFLFASFIVAHLMLRNVPGVLILTAVFIPTLIHVYVFTLLFMAYGTLQCKSKPGIIAIILLLLVPVFIMVSNINPMEYNVGSYASETFESLGFGSIHRRINAVLHPGTDATFSYGSALGLKIQVFVAFAYTYHYLNWFSKTHVIGWHRNLSRKKVIGVFALWILCISLYAYDYQSGMIALLS